MFFRIKLNLNLNLIPMRLVLAKSKRVLVFSLSIEKEETCHSQNFVQLVFKCERMWKVRKLLSVGDFLRVLIEPSS